MQCITFIKFVKIYLRICKTFTLSRKRSFYCNFLHFLWSTLNIKTSIFWIYKYKNIMRLQTKQKGWCYILREYVVIIMLYILFLLILRETQYILLKFYAFSICINLPENPVCWRLISPIIIFRLVISLHIQTRWSHLNKRQELIRQFAKICGGSDCDCCCDWYVGKKFKSYFVGFLQ